MKGVCASWTAGLRLTIKSRRRSPTPGALGPATSREGRGRGRRGRKRLLEPLPSLRFAALIVDNGSGMCWLVWLVSLLLVLCFRLLSMSGAIPQVQFLVTVISPVVVSSGAFGQTVQKTADSPQWQSIAGRHHPLRAANADPHGPVCSADHGDSTVAAYFGGRCSCCRVVQILMCCRGEALGAPTVAARREICDFLRPLVSDSHLFGVRVCLWRTRVWIFREMTSGIVSVLNTPRFDSVHIFGVSLRSLLEEFPSYFYAMLGSTVDTRLCVRLRRLVFWFRCTLRCFPPLSSGPRCLSSRTVWTRRNVMCGFSAVAVPHRSTPSLSFCRGSSPWSSLFSRPQRFTCCCSISGGQCPCYAGRAISPVQVVERTVKIPQSQLVENIVVALDFLLFVDMPVVFNNRCFGSSKCRKLRFRSCSSSRSSTLPSWHRCCPWSLRPWSFPCCVWTGRSMPLLCRSCSSDFAYSPLYLAVTCSVFGVRLWRILDFSG